MAKAIIHTKYRLQLGNPLRGYGITRLILGIILILIGLATFQTLGPFSEWRVIAEEIGTMVDEAGGRLSYGIHVVLSFIFGSAACLSGLAYFFDGLKHASRLYLPTKVPDDFKDPQLLSTSMKKREILTYNAAPTASLRFVRYFFNEGVEFIPPSFRSMVTQNTGYLPVAIIPIALICLVSSERESFQNLLDMQIADIPFPTTLLLAVLVIGAFRLVTALMLIPREVPSADFEFTNHTLGGAGHPETFLAELEVTAEGFRYMDIPNRIYKRDEIQLTGLGNTDTGHIRGGILLETQPIPAQQTHRLPGYLLLAAGVACTSTGLYLLCSIPFDLLSSPRFDKFAMQHLPETCLSFLVGFIIFRNGHRFFRESKTVLRRMLFQSDVFSCEFSGTFFKAEIGAGMARDDSLRTKSVTIRSEVIIRYLSARCLSESVGFGKRDLLQTEVPPELRQRLSTLKNALEQHQDRGAKLVGIDLEGSKAIAQVASTNISLYGAKEAAKHQAKTQAENPDLLPGAFVGKDHLLTESTGTDADEMKECAECAEFVRKKAKKCRFCGHRFDDS